MNTVGKGRQTSQTFPDPPACVVCAIREGQILRPGEESPLEFNCSEAIADGRIHHELAGDNRADRPTLHPHSTRYDTVETTNLFSLFLINQRRKIRVVPRIFKEEEPKMDFEFAGGKGISRSEERRVGKECRARWSRNQ